MKKPRVRKATVYIYPVKKGKKFAETLSERSLIEVFAKDVKKGGYKLLNQPPKGKWKVPRTFSTFVPGKVRVLGAAKRRYLPELKIPPWPMPRPRKGRRRLTVCRRYWRHHYADLRVDVPVLALLHCTAEEAARLISGWDDRGLGERWLHSRTLRGYITYPVAAPVKVEIEPCTWKRRYTPRGPFRRHVFPPRKDMCVGWFLWALAQAYKQVYERHEEFGVWGHDIGDLCFTTIQVANGRFRVGVDS